MLPWSLLILKKIFFANAILLISLIHPRYVSQLPSYLYQSTCLRLLRVSWYRSQKSLFGNSWKFCVLLKLANNFFFSLSCTTLLIRRWRSASDVAIRTVSSAYLRLFVFVPPTLEIFLSSRNTQLLYKLNKSGEKLILNELPFLMQQTLQQQCQVPLIRLMSLKISDISQLLAIHVDSLTVFHRIEGFV